MRIGRLLILRLMKEKLRTESHYIQGALCHFGSMLIEVNTISMKFPVSIKRVVK